MMPHTPAPSILEPLLSCAGVAGAGTVALCRMPWEMRQDSVEVLGHWEVTAAKGNVKALEPMGESTREPRVWVASKSHPEGST